MGEMAPGLWLLVSGYLHQGFSVQRRRWPEKFTHLGERPV